jgi:hypothetical protein
LMLTCLLFILLFFSFAILFAIFMRDIWSDARAMPCWCHAIICRDIYIIRVYARYGKPWWCLLMRYYYWDIIVFRLFDAYALYAHAIHAMLKIAREPATNHILLLLLFLLLFFMTCRVWGREAERKGEQKESFSFPSFRLFIFLMTISSLLLRHHFRLFITFRHYYAYYYFSFSCLLFSYYFSYHYFIIIFSSIFLILCHIASLFSIMPFFRCYFSRPFIVYFRAYYFAIIIADNALLMILLLLRYYYFFVFRLIFFHFIACFRHFRDMPIFSFSSFFISFTPFSPWLSLFCFYAIWFHYSPHFSAIFTIIYMRWRRKMSDMHRQVMHICL